MKTEFYQWMKNLTFFYVLFQAMLQLLPDKAYEKYVRFYMGLLLIVLMISPFFSLIGKGEKLWDDFGSFYQNEELERLEKEAKALEGLYLSEKKRWEAWLEAGAAEADEGM